MTDDAASSSDLRSEASFLRSEASSLRARLETVERQLDTIQRLTKAGTWEYDLTSGQMVWSRELFDIFGWEYRPTVEYETDIGVFTLESNRLVNDAIARTISTGVGYEVVLDALHSSGEPRTVVASGEVIRDADGRVIKLVGTLQDITARMLEAKAFRSLFDRYDLATNAAQIGIWHFDVQRGRVHVTEPMASLFETADHDGHDWSIEAWRAAVHEDDRAHLSELSKACLREGTPFEAVFRVVTAAGAVKFVRTHAIRDSQNPTRPSIIGVSWDVTKSRKDEDALRESAAHAEVLLQELHHRVKNNLQVIASMVGMQARQATHETTRDALRDTHRRVNAISLVHEQLYRAKNYSKIPFHEYANHLATNVMFASGENERIELVVDVARVPLSVDMAIPCGLVLNELLTNVIKHAFTGERRGKVRVSFHAEGTSRVLEVADDGVGLPKDIVPARASSLGLQLVSDLAHQLRGKIEVESEVGTTIRLVFNDDKAAISSGEP